MLQAWKSLIQHKFQNFQNYSIFNVINNENKIFLRQCHHNKTSEAATLNMWLLFSFPSLQQKDKTDDWVKIGTWWKMYYFVIRYTPLCLIICSLCCHLLLCAYVCVRVYLCVSSYSSLFRKLIAVRVVAIVECLYNFIKFNCASKSNHSVIKEVTQFREENLKNSPSLNGKSKHLINYCLLLTLNLAKIH